MAKGESKKWIKGKGPRPVDQPPAAGCRPPQVERLSWLNDDWLLIRGGLALVLVLVQATLLLLALQCSFQLHRPRRNQNQCASQRSYWR